MYEMFHILESVFYVTWPIIKIIITIKYLLLLHAARCRILSANKSLHNESD